MTLLTALIVKNSHILAAAYSIYALGQTWRAFNDKFGPLWKGRENSYQVRQVLALFCKLVALILG